MDGDFEVGDVVQLRSGGPRMTIASIDDNDDNENDPEANVAWFGTGDEPLEATFLLSCLKRVEEE